MPCDYRMKNYCFHPERANGKLVAINCVYSWLSKAMEEKSLRDTQNNLDVPVENAKEELLESKMLIQESESLG